MKKANFKWVKSDILRGIMLFRSDRNLPRNFPVPIMELADQTGIPCNLIVNIVQQGEFARRFVIIHYDAMQDFAITNRNAA